MALTIGTCLGPYEILSAAGAGGMGEVYKARDTRLDRIVAIKVLPSEVAAVASLRQRFEREARMLSNLTHPHICALHDVGSQDGVEFLVMEFLEGETLAQRLQRSKRPSLDEVLQLAIQIADALDTAHRRSIVHRDLKPGNIMLIRTGAKVLDFGLAKPSRSPVALEAHSMATTAAPITSEGAILGTLPYMAPEQLEGHEADTRSDIFAFGAVLYEMATGRRAFEGNSQINLIAAIVEHDPPPVSSLAPASPPWLDHVVKGCLAKDPEQRWQSIADVVRQLRAVADGTLMEPPKPARYLRRGWFAAATLTALAIAVIAGIPNVWRPPVESAIRMEFEVAAPFSASPYQMALSPSGEQLALTTTDENGVSRLWVRATSNGAGETLMATATSVNESVVGATWPAWSPDERYLAYSSGAKLRKIDLRTKESTVLADMQRPYGVTWGADDVILFGSNDAIFRISARGGTPARLIEPGPTRDTVRHPHFLPDGKNFIYLVTSKSEQHAGVFVASLDAPDGRRLVHTIARAAIVRPGYLLYLKPGDNAGFGTLLAQRIDLHTRQLVGDPLPIAEGVGVNTNNRAAAFTVSQTGLLAHRGIVPGTAISTLKWFDRKGVSTTVVDTPGDYTDPELSPDGKRAVIAKVVRTIGETDLWIVDVSRGMSTRFTSESPAEVTPQWSPDGNQIVFTSSRPGTDSTGIYQKSSDGSGPEKLLLSAAGAFPESWSPDSKFVLYRQIDAETGADLWLLPIAAGGSPQPFLRTKYAETAAAISPNQRWVAYQSNESGRNEVYVTTFPVAGSRTQVSLAGGRSPKWRGDGRELFFDVQDKTSSRMMAVDVEDADKERLRIGTPRLLFVSSSTRWDVTPDGKRFLMVVPMDPTQSAETFPPLTFVVNWQPRVDQRVR